MQKCDYNAYNSFRELTLGAIVLLSTKNLANLGSKKLGARSIGFFCSQQAFGEGC